MNAETATAQVRTARIAVRLAYAADALIALVWLSGIGWLAANHAKAPDDNATFLFGLFGLTAAAYAVVGSAVARRHDSPNAIAWLSFGVALAFVAGLTGTEYFVHAVLVAPGSLPEPTFVLALVQPTPILVITGIIIILFLFPTGRPLSRPWTVVTIAVAALTVVGFLAGRLNPHRITDVWSDRLDRYHLSAPNPFGVRPLAGVSHALQAISGVGLAVGFLFAVVSLVARRRRADPETHMQLRWLGYLTFATLAWVVVMLPAMLIAGPAHQFVGSIFWVVITPLVALGVPAAIGIAIVKYRLYDIDIVIRKTVVVAAVAVVVVGLYLLVIALATLGVGSRLVLGALLFLITFRPVLRTARALADRVAYGRRASSYEVLTEFTARVGETYAADDVLIRMAQILMDGTGARSARILINVGGDLREAAAVGDPDDSEHIVTVRDRGEELGALTVSMPANDPMNPAKQRLVDDLAKQAGLVLRNVRLIEDLRDSRQRLVAAQDEERRRIERNLHDGVQQQLVALSVQLGLLSRVAGSDPAKASEIAAQLQTRASETLDDLRDLARGIYPPLLSDKGLAAALEAQARKAAIPTTVHADGLGRYDQSVESAVYFCCLEALNNIAKYARASRAEILLSQTDGRMTFLVRDDGIGFDADSVAARQGTGLQGMRDRLAAVEGDLMVRSELESGTTLQGSVPAIGATP